MELDAAPQEVNGAGAAEDMLVEASGIGAREDERNTPFVLRELPRPFERVLAIGRIEKNPTSPRAAETAAHFGVVMHLGRCLPWRRRRAARVRIERLKGLDQAQRRDPCICSLLGAGGVEVVVEAGLLCPVLWS